MKRLAGGLKVAAMTSCIFVSWCLFIMISDLIVNRIDLFLRFGYNPLDLPPHVASYGIWDIVVYLPYSMKKGAAYTWKFSLLASFLVSVFYVRGRGLLKRGTMFHFKVGLICAMATSIATVVLPMPSIRSGLGAALWLNTLPNILAMLPIGLIGRLLASGWIRQWLLKSLSR